MALNGFQWWGLPIWGGKEKEKVTNFYSDGSSSSTNLAPEYVYGGESVKFPLKGGKMGSTSPSKKKKRWQSREERKIDKEHDVVVVPNDGVCLSGSESEDSDWSIGWLEPHGPDFLSDDETDDSFAVLVPCYRKDMRAPLEGGPLLTAIQHLANEHFTEGKNLMDQWLSSLQQY